MLERGLQFRLSWVPRLIQLTCNSSGLYQLFLKRKSGTIPFEYDLLPRTPFIIASNATKFEEKFGVLPDFEFFFAEMRGNCHEAVLIFDGEDEYN